MIHKIQIPKVKIELPEGDTHQVKVRFVSWEEDGTLNVCISIKDPITYNEKLSHDCPLDHMPLWVLKSYMERRGSESRTQRLEDGVSPYG